MGGGQSHEDIRYSVPIEGTKEKGFSHIYRNPQFFKALQRNYDPNICTLKDVIYRAMKNHKDKDLFGKITLKITKNGQNTLQERDLTKFKYGEILNMSEKVGSYLVNNKMDYHQKLHNMKLVGIFSKNRYQWLVADIACMIYGLTFVPLYETLGVQNLTYCLQHSGITTLFVTQATIKTILNLKGHGNLQNLISFDPLTPEIQDKLKKHHFKVFHFEDALKYDQFVNHQDIIITQKDCFTFSYTSGTTGPPKGAMISHGNLIAFLAGLRSHQIGGFQQDDSYVSFLPLPHLLERIILCAMIDRGCFVAFYSGDILKFKDDVAFIKPTILVAVPRLYNRVVQNVQKKFSESTGIKGCLVNSGVNSKRSSINSNGQFDSWFYDSIVFSKVKELFGGRIRMMITGSAPIKKETFQFMKIIMSCPFFQGYGQTENTGLAFATNSHDPVCGHVGGIASTLQFKLNDIEEMHYTSQDKDQQGRSTPRGEIWLRGAPVFLGYYKDQQKTRQAITPDGWLRTGDVGMLLPGSNAMKIIDRRKNIFKLQQGEYIAAEKVEGIYTRSHLVSEVFLHGDSHQNFAVAIVIPNKEQLLKVAQKHSINLGFEELCKDPKIRGIVIKQLDSVGKQGGLMSFEQAKNIRMDSEPFSNRGVVSSTMKLQRFAAKVYYAKQIEQMYKEGVLNLK